MANFNGMYNIPNFYNSQQPMFPQPNGNIYVISNSLEVANVPAGAGGIQRDLCTGFHAVNNGITENRFAAQQCCCETNRNIDNVRFENSKNTCDITNAIHAEGEATRALINANMVQDLRDRLEARDRDLLARDFQISQYAQNQTLINTLKPCPIPAYLTCSPYATIGTPNCGCNYGTFA